MAIKYLSFDAFGTVFNIEGIRRQMYEFVGARDLELYQRFQLRLAPYNWYANSVQQYDAGKKFSADIYLVGASAILHGLYDTLLKKGFDGYALAVALASFAWLAFLIERARSNDDEYVPRRLAKAAA